MEVKAKVRHLRMSPKKVRLVLGLIRGMKVEEAVTQLGFMQKKSTLPVKKLLESAIANAVNNFKLNRNDLFVKTVFADGGPIIKRWRPRAFGRAAMIRKRTSHVTIILDEVKKKGAKVGEKKSANAKENKKIKK